MSTYSDYQSKSASEKIGLVILEASQRLMGWSLYSGSIYSLSNFDKAVIVSIKDSGTSLTEVSSLASVSAGKFYNDKDNNILYLQTSDLANPNSKFLALVFRLFFSNVGVNLPYDLSTGFEVEWRPLFKGSSSFGVEIDNQNQLGIAIEGSGSVEFYNDQDFWKPIYDKLIFENQNCFIYSWNRQLPVTEAKVVYRGRIQQKSYSLDSISFQLKDFLNELRANISLTDLESYVGAIIPSTLNNAKQRLLYGYVNNHRPTNIDQVLDTGYTLSGTISTVASDATVTGSGTTFLNDLSPGDIVVIDNLSSEVTVSSVTSDTEFEATEDLASATSGSVFSIKPRIPKRYTNREWLICGHEFRAPTTTVTEANRIDLFKVGDSTDFEEGDLILIGASTLRTISRVSPTDNLIRITENLSAPPAIGTSVKRVAVTNVYINDNNLTYLRDYTYDASAGTLSLDPLAEFNISSIESISGTLTFNATSRSVTGSGTSFTSQLTTSSWIRLASETDFFEVLQIIDDTNLELRTASTYTGTDVGQKRAPEVFNGSTDVLSCDVLGLTDNGLSSGSFLKTGPDIVKNLLERAGLNQVIDTTSFSNSSDSARQKIGLAIPSRFDDTLAPTYREIINNINRSIFGVLIQNPDFELAYSILEPFKDPDSITSFIEADILGFSIDSIADNLIKESIVRYNSREYDRDAGMAFTDRISVTSENGQYLALSSNQMVIDTYLTEQRDAEIAAYRWAFIFELASNILKIETKLQASRLEINSRIDLSHEKLYQRIGSMDSRKMGLVQAAQKTVFDSSLSIDDLANAFSRCSTISPDTYTDYSLASATEKAFSGYITDTYGMIDNDSDTFGVNLIF